MGQLIIGGYAEQLTFNIWDKTCRAMQHVMLTRLLEGKSFFFRMGGVAGGKPVQDVVWISQSSSIRFRYDSEDLPVVDTELAQLFARILEESGGLVFPSATESEAALAEIEREQGS